MDEVEELASQLRRNGSVQVTVATDEEADAWRKSARSAARRLGRPVETVQNRHVVVVALRDWPANELEQQVFDAKMQNVFARSIASD
jgi:hypothetical protein